ncbi:MULTISPECIES: tetratricopeptide repeat protein [unclassified Proteiniphilum]|uniref:tetratricopeptide repeat protein n=1 Tax=unclassified Proteiniphilum TaxID=2622718 RepID=UPI00257B4236|nr:MULTISPECIES: tetratricopeptide repeat protein [unclassified Proteiniphilum]
MIYTNVFHRQLFSLLSFCLLAAAALIPLKVSAQQDTAALSLSEEERRKFDFFFYDALNAKAQGRYDEAMDLFQHCYALDSTNANVLVELGTFYNLLQEKNKALAFLRKAVHYDASNYYYNMMLAGLSKELGLKQEVVDIYSALAERHTDKPELQFELANAYADNGELQKAIDILDTLERSIGISEGITLNKYRLYSLMNNKEQAFGEIQQIINKNPADPRYLILMGDLYLEDNQSDKALQYYEQAGRIDRNYPALILSMVNYYEKTDNKTAAQSELQQAITGTSLDVETKLQLLTRYLGVLQQRKEDLKQANSLFHKLFEQYPNNTQLNMIYGNVLMLQNDTTGAMKQFEIYTKDNPDDPAGYDQMLRIILQKENMDRVREITTEALKHLPQEPQFYFYLGASYYQQKNYKEALRVFEEGLKQAVISNPLLESDFHGQIGDLNYFLGNKETAFQSYEKALKLNPQNLSVLNNYSYYLSLEKKDLDKAEQMSGITIKAEPMNPTFLDTYGWVLYEQGSYFMAKIYIEKAIEYSKENPSADVLEHYGDILYRTGDKEKALEQWKKARELESDSDTLDRKIETGTL